MLTPAWTQLRYHQKQSQLWRTNARFVAVAAGRGSGKTEIARRRIVRYLPIRKPWINPLYFYALPTYRQARRVAWRPLLSLIPKDWVKSINETDMRVETIYGSTIYVIGMDKPQRIEGDQWDGGVVDESCDQRPGSFDRSILPALSHRNGWCWRIGVPKRVGVGAGEFREFWKNKAQESYTWSSEDILTEEQLAYAKQALDEKDYNEQYRAHWEQIGGLIYYAFNEVMDITDKIAYDENLPLIIGSDFNVNPMAWTVCQEIKNAESSVLHVLDELFIRDTNTKQTLSELFHRYGAHTAGFNFFGDATSRSRNTRASESDYIQIKNDRRFLNARVFYPRLNPKVANRFAAVNAMFCNAEQVRRIKIHPRCKNLIRDLSTYAYKEGTSDPDQYGDVSHMSDAFSYVIHRMYPLRSKLYEHQAQVYIET